MGIELMAVAGVLLLGAGVAILVVNLGKARGGSSATIDQIQTYGYVAETTGGSEAESPARRPIDSIAGRLGDWLGRRSNRFSEDKLRDKLISAGMYTTTPRKILGYQLLSAIAFSILTLWLISAGGGSLIFAVVLAVAAGDGGWFAPVYYVELKRRKRMELIDKQMPDMIDLLVVTIEAGLGILASMRVASESMADPLGQELRLTLQEQRMGLSVGQAIESLGRRADAANMRIFVRAITQGERLASLDRHDDAEPLGRNAQAASGNGGRAGPEDAHQDALPADLLHLPGTLHRDLDADDHQHRRRLGLASGHTDAPPRGRPDRLRASRRGRPCAPPHARAPRA